MTKTLAEQAMEMYQRKAYKTLKLFKKTKKKSWSALGINPKMEALIYGTKAEVVLTDDINVEGTVTGRLPPTEKPMTYPMQRFVKTDISVLAYKPREIHRLKGQSSHGTMAIYASILEQEKFRADPRFPLFQIMERVKRYKAIFAGKPYLPIFS